jgi:hypothetical protein
MLEWIDDRFEGKPAPNDCDDAPPPTPSTTSSVPAKPRPPAATPISAKARFTG